MSDFARTRVAIGEALAIALGIKVSQGKIDSPSPNRKTGCVFVTGYNPDPADVNMQQVQFVVRVFSQSSAVQQVPETPLDPTELEDLAETTLSCLQAIQADQTIQAGFFQWSSTEIDHDERFVEHAFYTWNRSLFAGGG